MPEVPQLLVDEPSPEDSLGGAHERIARTIANLVRSSPGGHHLDGTWGSGKSSIVKMLTHQLEQTAAAGSSGPKGVEKFAVFLYDAWVHSGDPMRRAFLTGLISRTKDAGWLNGHEGPTSAEYWRTKLDRLSRRFKTTTRKSTPVFSPLAKIVLSALVGLGFAIPFFAELEKRIAGDLGSIPLLALTITSAVVAFGLVHLLSDQAMALVLRRTSDEEATEIREDPEPTTIEFQEAFGDLMSTVLSWSDRRLVIVIDNLDRIETAETRTAWALLRSFLDNPQFASASWFKRLWVVVPVADQSKMSNASAGNTNIDLFPENTPPPSFLEKVFQIRISLPPLMLHSWKNYLHECLSRCFGEDATGDFDEILRLYEGGGKKPVTPRSIVSFVNELVVLRLERDDAIPLSILAAYVLYGDQFEPDRMKLPDGLKSVLRDTSLESTFAMLHHRAKSPQDASYFSMMPRLEAALDGADTETIAQMLREIPAAEYVIDTYIRENLTRLENQQERLLQAVRALLPLVRGATGIQAERPALSGSTAAHLRQVAVDTLSSAKILRLYNPNLASGLRAMLDLSLDTTKTAELIVAMLRQLANFPDATGTTLSKEISQKWEIWSSMLRECLSIAEIATLVRAEGFEKLVLPIDSESWSRLCSELMGTGHEWILDCSTSLRGISSDLAKGQVKTQELASIGPVLRFYRARGHDEFYDEVARSVLAIASSTGPGPGQSNVEQLVRSSLFLFRFDKTRSLPYVAQMAGSALLIALAVFALSAEFTELLAATIYMILMASRGIPIVTLQTAATIANPAQAGIEVLQQFGSGKMALDAKRFQIFARTLDEMRAYEVLNILTASWPRTGMVGALAAVLANDQQFLQRLGDKGDLETSLNEFADQYLPDSVTRKNFIESSLRNATHQSVASSS